MEFFFGIHTKFNFLPGVKCVTSLHFTSYKLSSCGLFLAGTASVAILLCASVGAAVLLITIYFCLKSGTRLDQVSKKDPIGRRVKFAQVAPEDSRTEISNSTTVRNLKDEENASDVSANKFMLSDSGKATSQVASDN